MRLFYPCRSFKQQVMTSQIRSHRIFNTYLLYSFVHFVVEIDEKSSLNGGFRCDLMMTCDSGLLYWATLYIEVRTVRVHSKRCLLYEI